MSSTNIYIMLTLLLINVVACQRDPKVISVQNDNGNRGKSTGIFSADSSSAGHVHTTTSIDEEVHTVIAKKVLPTAKYVYILVQEDKSEFWIATTKQQIAINGVYFYRDGLLKTNFESKEHNRTFDKIYFVSKLVPADHGNTASSPVSSNSIPPNSSQVSSNASSSKKIERKGSVKVSELVANPKKYSGKTIQVSGECVKLNQNIMGRNWIHLKDGTTKNYDLVITSATAVPIGNTFTMTGTVVLDKDFGAGYRYDILLENGMLVE